MRDKYRDRKCNVFRDTSVGFDLPMLIVHEILQEKCHLVESENNSVKNTSSRSWVNIMGIFYIPLVELTRPFQILHIYPAPPLGQDMTEGQFLSGV